MNTMLDQVLEQARKAERRMFRAIAETENYKTRLQREKDQQVLFANESLLLRMLPVFDSLELCLDHATASEGPVLELRSGVELTRTQFLEELERAGAEMISAEPGTPFDPSVHEAVQQVDAVGIPANSITKVLRAGFMLHGRVLRAARVVVSTGHECIAQSA